MPEVGAAALTVRAAVVRRGAHGGGLTGFTYSSVCRVHAFYLVRLGGKVKIGMDIVALWDIFRGSSFSRAETNELGR